MLNYSISEKAESDLDELAAYIAQDNIEIATLLYDMAKETYEQLCHNSMIGREYFSKKKKLKGVRFFPIIKFSNYLVFYKVVEDGVLIIRVLHGNRHISKIIKTQ